MDKTLHWKTRTIFDDNGDAVNIYAADRWRIVYFEEHMDHRTRKQMLHTLEVSRDRNKRTLDFNFIGNDIFIYDQEYANQWNKPTENIVNELVFDILRNGRPEPTEWDTGKQPSYERWVAR